MENICIPMHLDAYVLSPKCCEGHTRVAPYTQPNYTALRLDSHLIQHDVLDHVDFHNTQPASRNPRVADIGLDPANNIKQNRLGVHLHWSLPRFYRAAKSSGRKTPSNTDPNVDQTQPVFRQVPNRWLVVRHLTSPREANSLPEYESWVVESDAVQNIRNIGDDVDLESDVAPFVSYGPNDRSADVLKAQTEVFLGQKFDLATWREDSNRKHLPGGLSVLNSSNPIFPDNALHNTNVFSIIDNFRIGPPGDDAKYLERAEADYYVIGWHQDAKDDPMNEDLPTAGSRQTSNQDLKVRLSQLKLKLPDGTPEATGAQRDKSRCLVFGSIFGVTYDVETKPDSQAEKAAINFTKDIFMEPLAVGTTPLDSILTFLDAHDDSDRPNVIEEVFGQGTQNLAKFILELSELLYASADEYDSRVQALDLISQQNYAKSDGGLNWTFAKKSKGQAPQVPSVTEAALLRELNEAQAKLDVAQYKLKSWRWQMFAEWWKYVSIWLPPKDDERRKFIDQYSAAVAALRDAMIAPDGGGGLIRDVQDLHQRVTDISGKIECKSSARSPFHQRMDPTLCIAGLESGWPANVVDVLTVQLESGLLGSDAAQVVFNNARNPIPTENRLNETALKLLGHCMRNSDSQNGAQEAPKILGFQSWGKRNPFVPVYVEWESLYYHINKDDWVVDLRPSPVGHPNSQVRYVPSRLLANQSPPGKDPKKDTRRISGRSLILPQPIFSLENVVLNVLDTPAAKEILTDAERALVAEQVRKIKFLSTPLAGLTNHLLTRCEGSHVTPNVRMPGKVVEPLPVAVKNSVEIGIDTEELQLVDGESSLTPYGNLVPFQVDDYPNEPFKGVTHGQMMFTKLHIIDKFGQAICIPKPAPRRRRLKVPPDFGIYPCLSDNLAPDVIDQQLNTVFPTKQPVSSGTWPLCPYIQLTPAINQNARMNASFLIQDKLPSGAFSPWRDATDYENPIWGWLIINYADNGLQFFESDGTFYCEIRQGGIHGTTVSATRYLPYRPKNLNVTDPRRAQLQKLLERLSPENDEHGAYLQAFFDMINGGIQNMPFPPSSYAAYANSVVGKPLALVNVGWSLELAEPAYTPQYGRFLRPQGPDPMSVLESYQFPLKIGDFERSFDGVLGYFKADNSSDPSTEQLTQFSKLYTYFNKHPHADVSIITPNDIKLSPYYIHPESHTTPNITFARERKYTVTSILMDPYAPIHGYSPILPTKALTLSPWTVEEAFKNMHAFFRLGPVLLTKDVPTSKSAIKEKDVMRLPMGGAKGTWSWLQPYAIDPPKLLPNGEVPDVATGEDKDTEFGEIPVIEDLGSAKFDKGPFTFVEGYLQLLGSLKGK